MRVSRESWSLNAGYHKMADKTAEAWRNGWFHTGDAFRVDEDGWYYFVDRMRDTIRRRGENISSFEVENAVIVAIICDRGDRYLSTGVFDPR